jgi:DNA-binding SARP family transcriptional activator
MEQHDASALPAEQAAKSAPWLRIHTLGQFQIDWFYPQSGQVVPLPTKKLHGQNAGAALGLLKALLSCPDRFATRAWLNEQFWPTSRNRSAEERLNDVVSSLRAILRPEGSMEMFVHFVHGTNGRGAGFRLDAHPQLWCDAEAFEWYVKHAMLLDQRGQDSTACWERAFYLAERGHYLPEQMYEGWARQKRDYLTGLTRDCVHHWTQLLRQMGHVDEAIMRLRSYWLEHLADEDALRPLLDMLGERERFGEAEEYYEKARLAFAEDNQVLDERTIEALESVRALKIRRPHAPPVSLFPSKRSFPHQTEHFQGIMLSQPYSGEQSLKHSRRQVLSGMVTSAYTMLTLSPYLFLASEKQEPFLAVLHHVQPLSGAVLDDLEDITQKYWKLSANLSAPLLSSLQGHFQSILHLLNTPHPSFLRQKLFSLASEAAQLLGKTLCDLRDYSLALSYYTFAVKAALEAKNNDIWATALGRIALLLLSTEQPQQALGCLQEIQTLPPSLKIRVWCLAIEAETYAYLDDSKQCQYALEKAKAAPKGLFLEADPYATGFTASRLASYEGSCYLHLHQPEKALPILQQAIADVDSTSLRSRSRLLTYEGMAYALLGSPQQACMSLSQALDLTLQTQSLDILHRVQHLGRKLPTEGNTTMLNDLNGRIQETHRAITHMGDLYE